MKVKCLLFDCDGVLIDSEVLWNKVEAEIKTEMGFPITLEEQYRKFVGMSHDSEEVKAMRAKLPPQYKDIFKSRYMATVANELKVIEGMGEIAQDLNVPYAIVSNSTDEELRYSLGKVGLLPLFESVLYSSEIVKKPKPDPAIYLHAAREMGVTPEQCIVIEDSIVGVSAAYAARMTVFGFYGATHFFDDPASRLMKAGANKTFAHARDLRSELKHLRLLR